MLISLCEVRLGCGNCSCAKLISNLSKPQQSLRVEIIIKLLFSDSWCQYILAISTWESKFYLTSKCTTIYLLFSDSVMHCTAAINNLVHRDDHLLGEGLNKNDNKIGGIFVFK